MADFPILDRPVHGKRLVYLDNAASSQKPQVVIDAMNAYYRTNNANVARGVHTLAGESTTMYEEARQAVAAFVGVTNKQVIFTSGATDSLNFVASWALSILKKDDEIVLSILEHHANIVPWQAIAKQAGAKIVFVGMTDDYQFDMQDFEKKLNDRTRIVAVSHASNVLGTVLPVKAIGDVVHKQDAYLVVDGAQAVGHFPVNIKDLDADFYAFSAHKMLGPQGVGVLVVKEELLDKLQPFRFGGGMIRTVDEDGYELGDVPQRFEAGTPNVAGAVGLKAAVDYLQEKGLEKIHEHETDLTRHAWKELKKIEGVVLFGPDPAAVKERAGIIAFDVTGVHPHDVAQVLDEHGVAIRSGMHCAMPLHAKLGIDALNRVSFALYNTKEDIDILVEAVKDAIKLFQGEGHA